MTTLPTCDAPDPKACAVAKAVGEEARPDRVILFGSRARGDYHAKSDIDLLIITDADSTNEQKYQDTSAAAHRKVEDLYGDLIGVDLVHLNEKAFHDGRRARNHVAGQAVRDGFDGNGDKVDYDNPEPSNWPDIRQRIANARRCLNDLEVLVEDSRSSQEAIGFHAQQAMENALKGWISALDADYRNTHDLAKLAAIVRRHPGENHTPAGEKLVWLTGYAVRYRYSDPQVVIEDRDALLSAVTATVEAIVARIRALNETATEEPGSE
ncbi:MAG: HEPN domain-containing protein [Gemmatimonadota bacterium]|nr:HEPN domain-containing protein [Gemmatimonadota bacterium]